MKACIWLLCGILLTGVIIVKHNTFKRQQEFKACIESHGWGYTDADCEMCEALTEDKKRTILKGWVGDSGKIGLICVEGTDTIGIESLTKEDYYNLKKHSK